MERCEICNKPMPEGYIRPINEDRTAWAEACNVEEACDDCLNAIKNINIWKVLFVHWKDITGNANN